MRLSALIALCAVVGASPAFAQLATAMRRSESFASNALFPCDDSDPNSPLGDLCTPDRTVPQPIGFTVRFFGSDYDSVFVNNNGNVTFDEPLYAFSPFDLTMTSRRIIAPFFADVDTRAMYSNVVTYGNDLVDGHSAFAVNWDGVGYYSQHDSPLNRFQLVLIDRSDVAPGSFDMEFNYETIGWDAGDGSGGIGGLAQVAGTAARVGFARGSGVSFELSGSGDPGALLDANDGTGLIYRSLGTPILGRLLFQVRNGLAVECQNDAQCDDGNPCMADMCDIPVGQVIGSCAHSPVQNGLSCDDGNACTEKDVCADGACVGRGVTCDDGNPCTLDACDPSSGCVATPTADGIACDDGDPCSTASACTAGRCAATTRTCQIDLPADEIEMGSGFVVRNAVGCQSDGKSTCAGVLLEAPTPVATVGRTLGIVSGRAISKKAKKKVGAGKTVVLALKLNKLGRRLLNNSSRPQGLSVIVSGTVKEKGRSPVSVTKLVHLLR